MGRAPALRDAHLTQMNDLVRQQTDEWSRLKVNQLNEVHNLVLSFMDARRDLLLKARLTIGSA